MNTNVPMHPPVLLARDLLVCGLSDLFACFMRWHAQMTGSLVCWRFHPLGMFAVCLLGVLGSLLLGLLARWVVCLQLDRLSSGWRVR